MLDTMFDNRDLTKEEIEAREEAEAEAEAKAVVEAVVEAEAKTVVEDEFPGMEKTPEAMHNEIKEDVVGEDVVVEEEDQKLSASEVLFGQKENL